jgi:membrane-bound hydrogenase subunit beta
MTPQKIVSFLEQKGGIIKSEMRQVGVADNVPKGSRRDGGGVPNSVWIELQKEDLKSSIDFLSKTVEVPHLSVISGEDVGDEIQLTYHLEFGYEEESGEVNVNLRIKLPKSAPSIPTITDILQGANTAERELTEFLGIHFEGYSDSRHLFLTEEYDGIYPWRKEEGYAHLMRDVV